MSLSHFDEKSGTVTCSTPWGKWWQTVTEVFIDVDVPDGTRAKDCKVVIKTKYLECKVKNEVIFQGDLFQNVVVDDSTWTLEEQKKISILLTKAEKFTSDNLWESLLADDFAPDAWTRQEMLKKLDLEKFQIENGSGEGDQSVEKEEAESNYSNSDNEEDVVEHQENAVERSSEISSPQSPAGSVDGGHSEDEVHISEDDDSNHGSDNEEDKNERESEGSVAGEESDNEAQREEKAGNDSDHEGSVPEINIQSEDEDNEEKVHSEVEDNEEKVHSEVEDNEERAHEEVDDINKISEEERENGHEKDDIELSGHVDHADEPSGKASPHQVDSDDDEEEIRIKSNAKRNDMFEEGEKAHSDGEEGDAQNEPGYGDLIANIFGDSDEEEAAGFGRAGTSRKKQLLKKKKRLASDSEDEAEKSEGEDVAMDHDEQEPRDEDDPEPGTHEPEDEPEVDKEVTDEVQASDEKSASTSKMKTSQAVSDDDSDDGIDKMREDFVSDFDLMMQKKKDNSKRRKRRDFDIINDSDDLIADIITQMRNAADEDRVLNKMEKTATKKLRILPLVMSQLKKQNLKNAFLDQGVLNVMADWLAPLPDRSLPNLQIREGMIKQLDEFPSIDQSLLKSSGVGKALMYLFKHPKETKENKEKAGRLITQWARPIFNVTTNYHSLTKEEREQRDFDHIPKKRKLRDHQEEKDSPEKKDIEKALNESDKKLRPGDKGWIGRARVPAPSTKDYVYRPKWNVEVMDCGRAPTRKSANRYEKHMRSLQEKKRLSKCQRAVTISIEGRKMAI